jgi:hypothetical protein
VELDFYHRGHSCQYVLEVKNGQLTIADCGRGSGFILPNTK